MKAQAFLVAALLFMSCGKEDMTEPGALVPRTVDQDQSLPSNAVNGGLFRYGLTARYSHGAWNGYLSMGKVKGQDFKNDPTIPFYAEFELQRTFGKTRKKQ